MLYKFKISQLYILMCEVQGYLPGFGIQVWILVIEKPICGKGLKILALVMYEQVGFSPGNGHIKLSLFFIGSRRKMLQLFNRPVASLELSGCDCNTLSSNFAVCFSSSS